MAATTEGRKAEVKAAATIAGKVKAVAAATIEAQAPEAKAAVITEVRKPEAPDPRKRRQLRKHQQLRQLLRKEAQARC